MVTNNIFANETYLNIIKKLDEQREKIVEEEMLVIKDWHNSLNNFFAKNSSGFVCINDDFYVKINDIKYSLMNNPTRGESPLNWYYIYGLRINLKAKTIFNGFSLQTKINMNDTIRICDENEFKSKLKEISENVFNDTPENFDLQFKHYTTFFYDDILFQYKEYFDDSVLKFVKKLEHKLNLIIEP